MNVGQEPARQPCKDSRRSSLDALGTEELEGILIDLLVVKYPGIEQEDIDCLLHALDAGAVDQVQQVEADMAVKSARWKQAAAEVDQ